MKFILKETQYKEGRVELTVKDKKLLQLLVQDGRASVTELAKKVGISKPAVVQKMESLTKKGVITGNVVYTDVKLPINKDFYLYELQTYVSMNNSMTNDRLSKVKGVEGVLWYNGPFNLIIASIGRNPQEVLADISTIVEISKYRYALCINNWFHPPHLFKEINDMAVEFYRDTPSCDATDELLLKTLESDPRATILDLAEKSKISVETAKNRLKRLKSNKSIIGISTYLNPWIFGYDIVSVSFITKGLRNTDRLLSKLVSLPQTGNVWEFAHEWNVNVVFWVKDQSEVSHILSKLYKECEGIMDTEVMVLAGMIGKSELI